MTDKRSFKSALMRRMATRFFIAAFIAAIALVLCALLAMSVVRQFVWQPGPLYEFLVLIRNKYAEVLIIVYIITLFIILYRYWGITIGYIEEIVDASEKLVLSNEDTIRLSPVLHQIELRMNQIKQTALINERTARDELQRKNDLIVYLAHDIKTPLTSVIGYLSLLDEAPDMPLEQKVKYVGITLDKAYRLDELIDEFFEITRFNLHHIEVNKSRINLALMLRQMADEFYPMLAPNNKTAVVYAKDDLVVWGDADKLSRVFNNILKNAIAYSYNNAAICISAFCQDSSVVITFANQGAPIPAEKLDRIFEKFFRLDAARSSHTGGAGLGLAIAKEIVEAHGGSISAVSTAEETVFTVILPNMIEPAHRHKK